ncbi:hypothetical protein J6590_108121, partial [Homalodisca vitripennis]
WKREDSFNVLAVVKLARRATVADEIAVESAGGAVKDCSCRHLERGSRLIKGLARAGERGFDTEKRDYRGEGQYSEQRTFSDNFNFI